MKMFGHRNVSYLRLSLSVILYILLFYSIFDIYYTSPLVHGVSYKRPEVHGLVKTVIFIVADGLRVDKLFTEDMKNTPTLRDILLHRGSWGLSHTRVPTESRPGHVALFAGFYEDVASITKGWQANAVEFDSVFNRSKRAYVWGGPDVVPMFLPPGRLHDDRVNISSYPRGMLDFTAENITQIDDWVLDQFTAFMSVNSTLLLDDEPAEEFRKGNIVFLHLSAADQIGHTSKPDSSEYVRMIQNVDVNIARLLALIDAHPKLAAETAFVFTADHGMTDWGSHGAGSLHETVTPLIVWGKNIPLPEKLSSSNDPKSQLSRDIGNLVKFTYDRRLHTVRQADLCPFVAALLGFPIPANSVGELPLDLLSISLPLKTALIRANALQIIAQFQIKYAEQVASHYRIFFREFSELTQTDVNQLLYSASELTADRKFELAIETYRKIMHLSLDGLSYYHKYDRFFMGICVIISYAVWSLILFAEVVGGEESLPKNGKAFTFSPDTLAWRISLGCILIGFGLAFTNVLKISLLHTVYQMLPLILSLMFLCVPQFRNVLPQLYSLLSSSANRKDAHQSTSNLKCILILVFIMEFGLWGFVHRYLLSIGAVLLGAWPFFDASFIRLSNASHLRWYWLTACCVLAGFPFLPMIGSFSSPTLVLLSSFSVAACAIVFLRQFPNSRRNNEKKHMNALIVAAALSGMLVFIVRLLVAQSISIPLLVNAISWTLLVLAPYVAVRKVDYIVHEKLTALTLAFFVPFNLMNVFYEGAFFLILAVVTYMWAWFESGLEFREIFQMRLTADENEEITSSVTNAPLQLSRIRQPVFYVFLLIFSFFGTGNIASVNTFDPISIYCFMTILNPAAMGSLMIFKLICPMVMVGTAFALIHRVLEVRATQALASPSSSTSSDETTTMVVVLQIIANFLAVHFLTMLRDQGSWLDIGESISHYVIAMSIGLASLLLALLGRLFLVPIRVPSSKLR